MNPGTGWIMCEGATRTIVDARVACPVRSSVTAGQCLDCRLLVTWSGERRVRGWCDPEPEDLGQFSDSMRRATPSNDMARPDA
jgi:hypothetical protein